MPSEAYRAQVQLLIRTLPFVAAETCFALKGGTAINLFVRNLPRLSVDIDLAYLPVADRAASLASLDRFKTIAKNLKATIIIQHDQRDVSKLPVFPAAAK